MEWKTATVLQKVIESAIALPVALAIIGGVVNVLHKGEERSLGRVLVSMLTAGFVGAITYLMIENFNVPVGMKAACVGMAGYASGSILPTAEKWISKEAKKAAGEDAEDSEK